jgi:hypothetical protein
MTPYSYIKTASSYTPHGYIYSRRGRNLKNEVSMKLIALTIITLFIPAIASALCFEEAGSEYGVPFFSATIRRLKLHNWPENLPWRLSVTGCNDFIFYIRNGPSYTPHG